MFQNDCMECEKKFMNIEEKQKEIIILQQNVFEMKNRIIDTSKLMNSWLICKKENEILKKELNVYKSTKSVSSEDQNYLKYQFGLLQNKYEKVSKDLESEKYKNSQFSAAHHDDNNMGSKELRIELLKLRKQIVEKDKEISDLHKIKSLLEKQKKLESSQLIKINVNEQTEKEEFLQKCNDDENKRNKDEALINDINIQAKTEMNNIFNKNSNQINDISYKELIEENEFLKSKYQKYNSKYIKFKAKYTESKNFLDLMMQMNILSQKQNNIILPRPTIVYPVVANKEISIELLNSNKILKADSVVSSENQDNILKRKRCKRSDSLKNTISLKDEKAKPIVDNIEIKEKVKKVKKIFKTDFEKKLDKLTETKEKLKRKKTQQEVSTTNITEESLEEKNCPLENISKCIPETVQKEFKLPMRRTRVKNQKIEDFQAINQLKRENYLILLNTESIKIEKDYHDYVQNFGSNLPEYEKTTQFLELIFSNYIPAKVDRILYLYVLFINKESMVKSINLFICLKDYVISNMSKLSTKIEETHEKCLTTIDKEIIEKINQPVMENNIISCDALSLLLSHFNEIPHLIAYFMIFTVKINIEYIVEFYKFARELLFESLLDFFDTIAISTIILNKLYENKFLKSYVKTDTMNKIYILNHLSKDFINENIINFINKFVSLQIKERNIILPNLTNYDSISLGDLDLFIKTLIVNQLNSLNQYILDENKNDKLNFGENSTILEIYQLMQILMRIKPKEWLNECIIQTILFEEFISCEKGSLKRIVIIFFVGILNNFIFASYNYQTEPVKISMSWLYSILDPQYSADVITIYDKISALSSLIELVKIDPIINQTVKNSVINLLKTHDKELFPIDLQEKLVRFKIVEKYEFK